MGLYYLNGQLTVENIYSKNDILALGIAASRHKPLQASITELQIDCRVSADPCVMLLFLFYIFMVMFIVQQWKAKHVASLRLLIASKFPILSKLPTLSIAESAFQVAFYQAVLKPGAQVSP